MCVCVSQHLGNGLNPLGLGHLGEGKLVMEVTAVFLCGQVGGLVLYARQVLAR